MLVLTIHWIEIKFSDSVPWMASNEAGWRAVCKYWATDGFKGVSLRNSSNRGHDVHHRYGGDGHVRLAKRMVSVIYGRAYHESSMCFMLFSFVCRKLVLVLRRVMFRFTLEVTGGRILQIQNSCVLSQLLSVW